MKLKFALAGSLLILITLASIDIFIQKNIYSKKLILEKYAAVIKYDNNTSKKEISISSIIKPILLLEDAQIINMQSIDNNTLKIQIKLSNAKNLKQRVESIESINNFKHINELKIMSLENKEKVAVLDVSFVK